MRTVTFIRQTLRLWMKWQARHIVVADDFGTLCALKWVSTGSEITKKYAKDIIWIKIVQKSKRQFSRRKLFCQFQLHRMDSLILYKRPFLTQPIEPHSEWPFKRKLVCQTASFSRPWMTTSGVYSADVKLFNRMNRSMYFQFRGLFLNHRVLISICLSLKLWGDKDVRPQFLWLIHH